MAPLLLHLIVLVFMSLFSEDIKKQLNEFLQEEPSTKDRPLGFRVVVGLLIFLNVFLILFCLLK